MANYSLKVEGFDIDEGTTFNRKNCEWKQNLKFKILSIEAIHSLLSIIIHKFPFEIMTNQAIHSNHSLFIKFSKQNKSLTKKQIQHDAQ